MAKENEKEKEAKKETKQETADKGAKPPKDSKESKEKDESPKKADKPKEGKDTAKEGDASQSKVSAIKNLFKLNLSKSGLLVLGLVAVNIILMLSVVYYIYYIKFVYQRPIVTEKSAREDIDQKKDAVSEIIDYKLDPFTVNLSKAKGRRYVNAKFVLIALNWDTRDELDKKVDKIRDAVIRILDDKYPEELITVQGKLFLKDQIITEVNRILSKGSIKEVFI